MLKLAAKSWVAKLATALFNFGAIILLSRYLGAADRGVCALYAVIIAISLVVNDLASGATIIYLMKKYHWVKMRTIYWVWAFAASGAICGLFLVWGKIDLREFVWLWPICWLSGTVTFQQHLMLGMQKFAWFNILNICSAAGIFILLWVLFEAGYLSTNSYLISVSSIWLAVLMVGLYILKREPVSSQSPSGWLVLAKKMFSTGGLNQSVQVAGMVNNRLIYSLLPAATLGAFSNGLALAEAMLLLPGSLGQIFYASMVSRSETEAGFRTIKKMMAINVGLLLAGWFAVLIIPGAFYNWLFGPGFADVKQYLMVLSAGIVCYGIYVLASYWHSAAGRFHKNLIAVSAGLAVNVAGLLGLKFFNALGVMNLCYLLSASFMAIGFVAAIQLMRQSKR